MSWSGKKKSEWVFDEYNLLVGKHLTRLTPYDLFFGGRGDLKWGFIFQYSDSLSRLSFFF